MMSILLPSFFRRSSLLKSGRVVLSKCASKGSQSFDDDRDPIKEQEGEEYSKKYREYEVEMERLRYECIEELKVKKKEKQAAIEEQQKALADQKLEETRLKELQRQRRREQNEKLAIELKQKKVSLPALRSPKVSFAARERREGHGERIKETGAPPSCLRREVDAEQRDLGPRVGHVGT